MPELPEIASRAHEMNTVLPGKIIFRIEVSQPKCLNMPEQDFISSLLGAEIKGVAYHGKWIQVETSKGWLLINLGMGGEVLFVSGSSLPEKRRVVFHFEGNGCLSLNFWWFGYVHFAPSLAAHNPSAKLGPNVIDLPREEFLEIARRQKGSVKSFLLDQNKIAGIGNAYVHDILFMAKIHPLKKMTDLGIGELEILYSSIRKGLLPSLELGGGFYEVNLFGQNGGFTMDKVLVGYRENMPCPVCATPIQKIKTGATSSYICPTCQSI